MQTTKATAFPSPSGDYFFNIPLKLVKDILNRCEQFPPPSGDYFFNASLLRLIKSVLCGPSFRPLQGIIFLDNSLHTFTSTDTEDMSFPSPSGDYFLAYKW